MAKSFYISYFAIFLNAGQCFTSADIATVDTNTVARPAAPKRAADKWTKPDCATDEHKKRNWINVIASGGGVSGVAQKIPLWIKVPRQ